MYRFEFSSRLFWRDAVIAAALSVAGSSLLTALSVGGTLLAAHWTIVFLGLAYCAALLATSARRTGRVLVAGAWLLGGACTVITAPALTTTAVITLLGIWLTRGLFHRRDLAGALCDGALLCAGLIAAIAAYIHTSSPLLGLWCFFALQALHHAFGRPNTNAPNATADHDAPQQFSAARGRAQAALRMLANGQGSV